MDLPAALNSLIEDMECLPDAQERLSALAAWGRKAPELPADLADESNRVHGCISRVHLIGNVEDGLFHCQVSADSAMVRGLVGVTVRLADGKSATSVAACDFDWPQRLGLDRQITPTRLNGLAAVAERLRQLARGT
jgi:cysteine desulfuration protein SufE